jgi:hypothetical protein
MSAMKTNTNRQSPVPPSAVYLGAAQLRARYGGVSHMWIERKLQGDPAFPRPKYFGRMRFWAIAELETYEGNAVTEPRRVVEAAA